MGFEEATEVRDQRRRGPRGNGERLANRVGVEERGPVGDAEVDQRVEERVAKTLEHGCALGPGDLRAKRPGVVHDDRDRFGGGDVEPRVPFPEESIGEEYHD